MKAEYEKALEAARDVIYGVSNIDPLDALANLLSAIEAQGDEGALPSDYIECRTIDGGVWYYPRMPDVAGEWSRALRLADDAADWARLAETRLIEAEQRAERAEARVAELEADARRWRKCKRMRKSWWLEAMAEAWRKGGRSLDEQIDEQPDAAIDAARQGEGGAD